MHKAFQISPENVTAAKTNLFVEISNRNLSFFYQDVEDKRITGLSVFNFTLTKEEADIPATVAKIFDHEPMLKHTFNKTFVSYAFNESILTPSIYHKTQEDEETLNLIYGDLQQGIVLRDHLRENDLFNIFRVSNKLHQQVITRFDEVTFVHQYSLLIKQVHGSADVLKVIFYRNNIVMLLQNEGKLRIIQSFNYITSTDVLYHLLNVCNQFGVSEVNVHLSGMIESNSPLLLEIQQYFSTITFAGLPAELSYADEIKTYPPHFFNHLFSFALCV